MGAVGTCIPDPSGRLGTPESSESADNDEACVDSHISMRLAQPLLALAFSAAAKCYVCGHWSRRARMQRVRPHGVDLDVEVCRGCASKLEQAQAVMRAIKGT